MTLRSGLRRMTRPAQRTQIRRHIGATSRAGHNMIHIERTHPAALSAPRGRPQNTAPQPMPLSRQPRPALRPHRQPPKASPKAPRPAAKATQDASQPSVRKIRDKPAGHRLQNPYRIEHPHNGAVRRGRTRAGPRGGPDLFVLATGAERPAMMAAATGDDYRGTDAGGSRSPALPWCRVIACECPLPALVSSRVESSRVAAPGSDTESAGPLVSTVNRAT